jgi:hypothetical protein
MGAQFAYNEAERGDDFFAGLGLRAGIESSIDSSLSLRLSADLLGVRRLRITVDTVDRWDTLVFATFNGGVVGDFF